MAWPITYLDSRRHEPPWIWLEAQFHISDVSFPWVNPKIHGILDVRGLVQLITNPTRGITNNNSLIIKTQVVQVISDCDAVFVEGNIKAAINKQKCRMVPL